MTVALYFNMLIIKSIDNQFFNFLGPLITLQLTIYIKFASEKLRHELLIRQHTATYSLSTQNQNRVTSKPAVHGGQTQNVINVLLTVIICHLLIGHRVLRMIAISILSGINDLLLIFQRHCQIH